MSRCVSRGAQGNRQSLRNEKKIAGRPDAGGSMGATTAEIAL